MAVGLVVEALLADQDAARRAFAERYEAFASPKRRALMRDTFPRLEPA
jgi:hypothetical protein